VGELGEKVDGGGGVTVESVESGQGVGVVVFAWSVLDDHVGLERGEVEGPAGLSVRQVTLREEVLEGMVVSVDGEALASFQVVSKLLDSVDDSE
jgi:hypothetical protein